MGYHYDPILCMNVPDSASKAKDASWKAWTLYIDGKWVKSFSSSMAPIKEAQKFMKENYPCKVGKLVRNTGSSSGYSISGREYKDAASVGVRDASDRDKRAFENIKNMVKNIQRSSDVLHDFIVIKNTANQIQDKILKAEAMKIVNSMASKIRSAGAHDSLDKAIRTSDRFTVWESDEYDDIYVSYEGGTYVLYVENRPQADGSQQKMIQLGKQEERMRG